MSDLHQILPDFETRPFSHLLFSLDKNNITVAELISLDPIEVARKCPLPLLDVKRLVTAVVQAVQAQVEQDITDGTKLDPRTEDHATSSNDDIAQSDSFASARLTTLDAALDNALGGGLYTGHIIEIVGESAVGKTQFVLGLLLSVQLRRPRGLGRGAIYLTTEAPLSTTRLEQMLRTHPIYEELPPADRPSLNRIHTISINDIEAQQHIMEFQLPLAIAKYDIGLIVVDSIAANFRAEHETRTAAGLGDRATDISRLGSILRRIAVEHNLVVVVTNQVSDRFEESLNRLIPADDRSSSPAPSSTAPVLSTTNASNNRREEVTSFDYQQRFFTGWGGDVHIHHEDLKTPTLGLAWTNQISARIALKMEGVRREAASNATWTNTRRRRFARVVFAPWVKPTGEPIEYDIEPAGIRAVQTSVTNGPEVQSSEQQLGPEYISGFDGADEDEEFP